MGSIGYTSMFFAEDSMELTDVNSGVAYSRFYDVVISAMGISVLIIAVREFWRHPGDLQSLSLVAIVIGVVAIGLSYFVHRRKMIQVGGKIGDKDISVLSQAASSMAFFGYLICEMALVFGVRH